MRTPLYDKYQGPYADTVKEELNQMDQFEKVNKYKTAVDAGLTTMQLLRNTFAKPLIPLAPPVLRSSELPSQVLEQTTAVNQNVAQSRNSLNALRDRNIDTGLLRRAEVDLLESRNKAANEIAINEKDRLFKNQAAERDIQNKNVEIKAQYDAGNRDAQMKMNEVKSQFETDLLSKLGAIGTQYFKNKFDIADQRNRTIGLFDYIGGLADDTDRQYFLSRYFTPEYTYINRTKESMSDEKGPKGKTVVQQQQETHQ